jgi:hypothetical protein
MPSSRLVLGGAAATAMTVRVARSLYSRWLALPESERRRIEDLAEDLKRKALDLRGALDRERATRDARGAGETLAAALVETAEARPEVSADEVRELREDLRRELERLMSGDIKASRTQRQRSRPPG